MPKSTKKELYALREEVFIRDHYRCVWPGCSGPRSLALIDGGLQLAHLVHRGMGGSKYANRPENCVTLCSFHHDIFDGRDGSSNVKREIALMLKTVASVGDGGVTP
jgi:5-methylcytosine-specific restriction endonuclease McrA